MPRILIIEDEERLRSIVGQALIRQGFEVDEAPDGATGVEMARLQTPDLVLCDINMEGMNGYDVLSELRQNPSTAATPFILMTGDANFGGMRQGMTLGADDYLPKPFKVADLLSAVTRRLQKDQLQREMADRKLASLRTSISMMLPHELLTPLTGILGASDLIRSEAGSLPQEQLVAFADAIHQSGVRLQRLIQNFLIYAQIELLAADSARLALLTRGPTPRMEQILIRQAVEQAEAVGRTSDLQLDLGPATLAISEEHLRKIFHELLDNALKFSKPGTPVVAESSQSGPHLCLEIRDRGRGMTPEDVANIGAYTQFERKFYEQQGSGLGLTIARRLVEIHGGQFSIRSELNQGTQVNLTLPLV